MVKTANVKKLWLFIAVIAVVCVIFACVALFSNSAETVISADEETTLTLQIGNPQMTVNGMLQEVDPGRGTTPVLVSDRTLMPVRAIIESVGGTVG